MSVLRLPVAGAVASVASVLGGRTTFEHLGRVLKTEAFGLVAPVRELIAVDLLS